MVENNLREDTKVLAFDNIDEVEAPDDTVTTDRGTVTYDMPPEKRGETIVIDFEEQSEPGTERQAIPSEPETERQDVPCCTGAMQASVQQWGRRTLCLACANVYQYGGRVDSRPDVRRQVMGDGATPFDIWRR